MIETRRVKIGDFFEVETGSTPSTAVPDYWEGGNIKWITPLDLGKLNSPFISRTSRNITRKGLDNSSATIVPAGSIIISTRAPIGYLAVLTEPMAFNQGCKALLPKNGNPFESLYVYYQLQTKVQEMKNLGSGSTFKEISKEKLESIRIQVPPLPIQKQIAAILEKADAAREKRQQANQLTEQFLQSAFLEMFGDPVTNPKGWENVEAGKLFEIKLGKMLDEKRFTGKNPRPYLRNLNVQWDGFDLTDIKEMDFTPTEFERNELRCGDILVCEGGEVGRCAIWGEQIPDCGYQKALHRLRVINPIIEGRYFVNFMKLAATHGLLLRDTSQVTIAHFTAEKFREFKVLVPPLREQQKFAALVEKVDLLRAKQRESEKELDNLFNSLMQRAFRGELIG